MRNPTHRRNDILELIVQDYIASANPIGSVTLVREHQLGVSPATVRNEMMKLEEQGYIRRPHPSAGSVPSDKGYRFFVERLPRDPDPPATASVVVNSELENVRRDMEQWAKAASTAVSRLLGTVAFTTSPRSVTRRIKHLELIYLQDTTVLLVLVLHGASIHKLLVPLDSPVSAEQLEQIRNRLSGTLADSTATAVESALAAETDHVAQEVIKTALDVLRAEDAAAADFAIDGLGELFAQPEFASAEQGRDVLGLIEEPANISALASRAPDDGTVTVFIGSEMEPESMHTLSVVIGHYGVPGEAFGTIGTIGPTRLEYQLALPVVRYAAVLMSRLISEMLYGDRSPAHPPN